MAKPEFPRPFHFELPLFESQCGPASPWLQAIPGVKPDDINEKQARKTYEIFRDFATAQLEEDKQKRQAMIDHGQQGTPDFQKLQDSIAQQEAKFENGGGGKHQFPFINYNDFSFPIYRVKRDGQGNVLTGDVKLQPYDSKPFPSPWFPRSGNKQSGFMAHSVPLPDGKFRPGGPEDPGADGNIILYDVSNHLEYDFWQVTTALDANGLSKGGGIPGEKILATGSVSCFDTRGVGVRDPEIDPNGSSRATGLPYLGGLLLPEDLKMKDGEDKPTIKHALIFAMPRLRYFKKRCAGHPPNWVYPATRTEFHKAIPHVDALAAGQRICLRDVLHGRDGLKEGTQDLIKDKSLPPIVRSFLDVLYNYGAYLVDGGGGFGLAAEDIHTAVIEEEQALKLAGLDAIDSQLTPWEAVLKTLNHYLFAELLDKSGLAFAYDDDTNGFRPNFSVAQDLEAFYPQQN